ncbi:MAG TPA: glycosyltransferase family 4 protein [Pyrinomonadaceae bacterium]|nr:glycosyltransferase family 4 protein [Pyrinomonadaceae bacterium]
MNIALVVHDLHERGGHSLYTKVLADGLSARHEVAVFANRFEPPDGARWRRERVRALRGSALACVQTFPLGLRARASALGDYEIRHAQGYCGGRPNVVTAHICVAAYLDSLRSATARHRLSLQLMAAAEGRFYRRYEGRVIAVSHRVARELRERYGASAKMSIVPHGVEAARFGGENRERQRADVRRQIGVRDDQTLALYVGDLAKAHTSLKELAEAAPDVQFAFATYSRAYRLNGPNVRVLPPTGELERYYAAADAFVFPTTCDAFGMVLLEAMASGLAVFSSDRAGAAELIDAGRDGFVTPLDEWVESTAARLRDPSLLRETGRAAAETARLHDWPSVVGAVERIYEEVAAA